MSVNYSRIYFTTFLCSRFLLACNDMHNECGNASLFFLENFDLQHEICFSSPRGASPDLEEWGKPFIIKLIQRIEKILIAFHRPDYKSSNDFSLWREIGFPERFASR